MGMNFTFTVELLVLSTIVLTCSAQTSVPTGVFVNGQELPATQLSKLEQTTGVTVAPGRYWYDGVAGAYGCMGGPTKGSAPPGLQAAPLPATASNGATGVFINGRELPTQDLNLLQQAIKFPIPPGRYWIHSDGSYGAEGDSTPVGTLATSGGNSGGGGGGGCTTTNGGNTICSGDGLTSVSGEDSLHNPWSVSSDSGRRLSFARGRSYNTAGRKLLQKIISCPTATSTTPSTPGSSPLAGTPG